MDLDLSVAKELLELLTSAMAPITAIILSLYGWRKTGEVDLRKTLTHAEDVAHLVFEAIKKGIPESAAIDDGVAEIAKIRGKKALSTKLKRKAKARLKMLLTKMTE